MAYRSGCLAMCCGAALFWSCLTMNGQTFNGTVVGRVNDPTQAAIPNAELSLRSVERGFERHTTTNGEGEYTFQLVPPGKFSLTAKASGFGTTTKSLEVVVATTLRADVTLTVQALDQSIQIVGESGVSVQTENANLGLSISPSKMSDLPSLTRSPYDFMAIMPGANVSHDLIGVGFSVNGGRTQSANYLLDGGENNEAFMSAPAQDVPLDSIQEFYVQTNHYSAEYGRNSGFTANIVTKSGTNAFHGSVYDYNRNSAFATNSFDNNANDLPRPVFNRNQFGGTLGGPIRSRKVFFFAAIEPILVRSTGPNPFFVPTPELLSLSSPGTQSIFQKYPLPPGLSSSNVYIRTVCPYTVSCNSSTRSGYVDIPAFAFTSRSGPQDAGAGPPQNTILATGRIDWVINSKTQAFVRYAFENKDEFATVYQPYSKELDVPLSGRNQSIAVNLIRLWSPDIATESRIVYNRVFGDPDRFTGTNPLTPNPPIPAFSIINENNQGVVLPFGTEVFGGPENVYQFFQTVTWIHHRHNLKAGGQFIQMRDNRSYGINQVADAQFSDVQDFVDGKLHSYEIALDPKGNYPGEFVSPPFGPPSFTRHFRYNEPSFFITDTWKITPRLTLTPGLRWEYFGVLHSPGAEHSLDSNFYPGAGSNVMEQIANGQILQTIDAPGSLQGRFYLPDYHNFAPRLGVAYDPLGDGKTVIRAGAGIFYDRRVGWELFRVMVNPPSYSIPQLQVPVTADMLVNQYAAIPNQPLQLSQSDAKPIDPHLRPGYTFSWNLTVEHEFANTYVFGASYLGSSASQLYSIDNLSRFGSGGLLNPTCITTRYAADGITPLGPDYKDCPGLNPNVASLSVRGNEAHSTFEALQLRLDSRRLSHWGIEFGVNYTWSHSIDNQSVSGRSGSIAWVGAGYLDAFQPGLDRGSSDFDQRHRFSAHWVWSIPLGRNSRHWESRYLLGGWEISGLLSAQTGQPFSLTDYGVPDRYLQEMTRPRLTGVATQGGSFVPDASRANSFLYVPINQVYDPASGECLANAKPFACEISVNGPFDGNLPRNTYRTPGTYYQNTALLKNFPLSREGMQLQLRAEFFNLLNHPNLYVNGGTNDVSSQSFTRSDGEAVPGVTTSFKDNRQIVFAIKLMF